MDQLGGSFGYLLGVRPRRNALLGGKEINVKDHFEITVRGRDYLRLRAEMLVAISSPGASQRLV